MDSIPACGERVPKAGPSRSLRPPCGKMRAMPTAPDFRLYHSNSLEVLAGFLAQQVLQVPADGEWLRPDVVLVTQFSIRHWLHPVLADELGIGANQLCRTV